MANKYKTLGPGSMKPSKLIDRGGGGQRPMPAVMPSTEIEKRFKKLEKSSGGSKPLVTNVGDNTYEWTEEYTWIAYASDINNASSEGVITSQQDAVDFSFSAISESGDALNWLGYWTSKSLVQSGDPTDYIWTDLTADIPASSIALYYTESTSLLPDIGNPTYPKAGITWTSFSGSTPASAFWVATQYTINGTKAPWRIIPVRTKQADLGLIIHAISGRNKPTLNDSTWKADAITAISTFTGNTYSTTNEMGFGTTIVITYDNGKLYGQLKKVSGVATWVAPVDYIDGDLLVNSTIITEKIADNAINTAKILNDAIDATKIADNAVTTAAILNDAINADKISNNAVTTAAILADAIDATKIADNAVVTAAIADNAVVTAAIAANAITTTEITDDAITTAKITTNAITANEIAANAVTASEIAANAVTASKILAGEIGASHIAANSLTAGQIATNAITADEIQAGAIGVSELAADSVTANAIAANTITATEIQADAIGVNELAANSVTADAIAANAVTASEIAAGAITATEIATDAVTANKVAANAIVADNIVSDAITTDKINANAVTGAKISSATTITAGTGNNVGVLDGADSTYRIYAGHATPASAPFRVKQDGTVIIESAASGSRLVLEDDTIKVYNGSTLRVKLGNLA